MKIVKVISSLDDNVITSDHVEFNAIYVITAGGLSDVIMTDYGRYYLSSIRTAFSSVEELIAHYEQKGYTFFIIKM